MAQGNKPEPSHLSGEVLADLLKALVRTRPRPQAWSTLTTLARTEYGEQADSFLATVLGQALSRRSSKKQVVIGAALSRLLAADTTPALVLSLSAGSEPAGRLLALLLLGHWPPPLVPGLQVTLRHLLLDRSLLWPAKLLALSALARTAGTESRLFADMLRPLREGRSKARSIERLRRLEKRTGPSSAIDALCRELEESLRLSCPRCDVQLRRPQMIAHLWEQHQLVLDGRGVRDPWSLIDDWINAYRTLNDPELLERCRILAARLDADKGLRRLQRLWMKSKVAEDETLQALLDEARREHASICPWCFALVAQPEEVPPLRMLQTHGCLGAEGYNVKVSDSGWHTFLEIRTPGAVLYQDREPERRWTRRGATVLAVGPLLLLAVVVAFGWLGLGRAPLGPVLILLGAAVLAALLICVLWRSPLSPSERAWRYAWTLLVPALHAEGFSLADSAFLAGLSAASTRDGLASLRQPLLGTLVERTEQAVAEGTAPPSHLAAVRRLQVSDAVLAGADPIPLIVEEIARSLDGKLPLVYVEHLLDGWESTWWTKGNLNRLRVLLCDRAFEAGYEVRNLVDAGQTVPSLGTVLRTERPNELSALRLLWSLRAARPWDRCGKVQTVFELAVEPESAELLSLYPDLLLWQEEPTWPKISELGRDNLAPVQILFCTRGVVCQSSLFSTLPRRVEMTTQWRSCELRLDDKVFWSKSVLDELERRLERWFRYVFLDFLPLIARVQLWQSPDATTLFRAWGAQVCPECQKYFLPRICGMGVAQNEAAPVAQIVS